MSLTRSRYQSAYQENHSCETALMKVAGDILWGMEHLKVTAVAAIDLSAAFDTVDHQVLADVLEANFGGKETALDWSSTYVQPRGFKVNV